MASRKLLEQTLVIKGKANEIHLKIKNTDMFKYNHEIIAFAMMVGIVFGKSVKEELMPPYIQEEGLEESVSVESATMLKSGKQIRNAYRFCMLLHDSYIEFDERVKRAFVHDVTDEDLERYEEILFSYMRGGYLLLEEKILNWGTVTYHNKKTEDFIRAWYELLEEMNEKIQKRLDEIKQNRPMTADDILKFTNELI